MKRYFILLASGAVFLLAACTPVETPEITYNPGDLRFSGDTALAIETDFVTRFPNRDSGEPNNLLAAEWLADRLKAAGLNCHIDAWEFVNFSRVIPLHNAVCILPGGSDQEIVLTAHHDQAPMTVQGADNDGSGISILVQLAEIFASEGTPPYTLVFVFADAEEYGNAGTARYLDTHPDPEEILAAVSLDNIGKELYTGLEMDPRGRFRGYGPVWLQRVAQEAARAASDLRVPTMFPVFAQALFQAVPLAFMDEGPFVEDGIPSFGFAGTYPAELGPLHQETYHSPHDTLEYQSAESLGQAGLVTEALVRQLLKMDEFPRVAGPYLYFEASATTLRGLPLTLIFLIPIGLFLASAFLVDRRSLLEKTRAWSSALPHFLSLWLPLAASVVVLYLLVAVGLLDKFTYYFATTKHPVQTQPRWLAIIIWIVALGLMFALGRRLAARFGPSVQTASHAAIRSLAFLVIGLAALFVFLTNPFSLVFFLPLFFWLLIRGRRGAAFLLDLLFFLLGGVQLFVLIYFFGFMTLHIGLYILWYLLMMFAIPMVHPAAAVAITGILGAGLSLVVRPPRRLSS
ncbi:MAG TPA: M28 family peptidase [Anaerolineales bacterium]|nr:M28 family peptidase [Anaerolineales bacterium]